MDDIFSPKSGFQSVSVGQASALIAVAIFVVGSLAPPLVALITSAVVGDTNTAGNWSVAGRNVQQTLWPWLLGTDTTSSHGIRWQILFLSWTTTFLVAYIGIVGVVTPLGLYEVLGQGGASNYTFRYLPDDSSMNRGMPQFNSSMRLNRVCMNTTGTCALAACPGTHEHIQLTHQEEFYCNYSITPTYNSFIPQHLVDTYTSGFKQYAKTVSTFFDIQWRQQQTVQSPQRDYGEKVAVGAFSVVDMRVLEEGWDFVEGILADRSNGGIAFRNHTAPVGNNAGYEWSEDLLFINPESACVDLNITMQYKVKSTTGSAFAQTDSSYSSVRLIDRGGIRGAVELPVIDIQEGTNDVDVYARALAAGRLHNHYLLRDLNISYPAKLKSVLHAGKNAPDAIFPMYQLPQDEFDYTGIAVDNYYVSLAEVVAQPSNPSPEGVEGQSEKIRRPCDGISRDKHGTVNQISIGCALLVGNARPVQGGDAGSEGITTDYSVPFYSCSMALKASIKTVSFRLAIPTASSPSQLEVVDVKDRKYDHGLQVPLWAVEKTGYPILSPLLWGMVDESVVDPSTMWTIQREHLYLVGLSGGAGTQFVGGGFYYNLPASDLPTHSIGTTMMVIDDGTSQLESSYTGEVSKAMQLRWASLSSEAASTNKILDLIWTDIATNAVRGGRGVLGQGNSENSSTWSVTPIERQVKLHTQYAIPAFVAAGLLGILLLVVIGLLVFRRAGMAKMRRLLHQTSGGRILTAMSEEDPAGLHATAKEWTRGVGLQRFDLSGSTPLLLSSRSSTRSSTPDEMEERRNERSQRMRQKYAVVANHAYISAAENRP